jgi:hypothetical protein
LLRQSTHRKRSLLPETTNGVFAAFVVDECSGGGASSGNLSKDDDPTFDMPSGALPQL